MRNKYSVLLLLCFFSISSIPDSLGCPNCLERVVINIEVHLISPSNASGPSDPVPGKMKSVRTVGLDQNGIALCHFCSLETAANLVGFNLPRPMPFSGTEQIIMFNTSAPFFPISKPPENLTLFHPYC